MEPSELKSRRQALGLSREQFAERLGLARWGWQTVGKWERGVTPIRPDVPFVLAELELAELRREAGEGG